MNLALRDVRRHLARFVGTAAGLGLLLSVVVAMQGIYAGMVDDATILTRAMHADLWLVQRDTRGPFAEGSRLDPSVEARAAAVPGVRTARPYTYQLIQREHRGAVMRIALVGLGWPDDPGRSLPLVRGRRLQQPHGEMIVDASLGLGIGEKLMLAGEHYRVVGLTRNALTSGGDSVAFMTVSDAELVAFDQPPEAAVLERQRVVERLRRTDLGRGQPALEDLATDPRWRAPALASPPVAAVLVEADPHRLAEVREVMRSWGDVSVYSQSEEEALLLGGVVQRARMQIGLFTAILTLTAAVIVMMVMYNLTLEKTHDLAVLKLMGAPKPRLLGLVLQQAWLLGALGYAVAFALGEIVFPMFPRRVLITETISMVAPIATMAIVTLASILGLTHVMRIDPSRALEG
ncbi:MAG: ABC transporter permease [Myxococcales bacterium]|jgi:putative ABC transport system permease protein|nr:ABC transporter permease [Archangiaceae bacterium]MCA9589788.1 ABC transporter permease [Myxococcales bacterium]MCB9588936.1 ABC transporter permease [Polyangiaceae bacterium]